jgi:hypothetical protein
MRYSKEAARTGDLYSVVSDALAVASKNDKIKDLIFFPKAKYEKKR